MTKYLLLLIILIGLLGSCKPAPASPTHMPTAAVPPTRTPRPTQTTLPTATPYPPLQTEGPYLLFTYDNKNFTIMDADGSGRKQFQLPDDGYIWYIDEAVSPDGKWLAYFKGLAEEPYDLTLNLLNIPNLTDQHVSRLIAPGFPENLEPLTETIEFDQNIDYDKECSADPICRLRAVEIPFIEGIWRFDWSPDSQNIAFAAQIDGLSSDVYIYNLENKLIQRLTNEIENIGLSISWSPDGEKILYEGSIPGTVYTSYYLHVANPKIKLLQDPISIAGGIFWARGGWITKNLYMLWSGGEGAPPHNFRQINIETEQVKQIWRYVAESFFIDTESRRIFLLTYPGEISGLEPEPEEGLYLVEFDGEYRKISDAAYIPLNIQGTNNAYFALAPNPPAYEGVDYSLFSIGTDGSVLDLARRIGSVYPNVSPNKKWTIIASTMGTELFSENLEPIRLLDEHVFETVWRPDSSGIFIYKNRELFYLPIPDGEPKQVDLCSPESCRFEYTWLP